MSNSIEDTFETATYHLKRPAFWIDSDLKRCTACNEEAKKLFGVDTVLNSTPQTLRMLMEEQKWCMEVREGRYGVSLVARPLTPNSPMPLGVEQVDSSLKVLLLDDSRAQGMIGKNMLARLGHRCTAVENVKGAISTLEKAVDDGAPFQVLVSDIVLNGMENGVQFLARVHEEVDRTIYAIAITAQTAREVSDSELESGGFQAVLRKPFAGSALGRLLDGVTLDDE